MLLVDGRGRYTGPNKHDMPPSDQIAGFLPAVPAPKDHWYGSPEPVEAMWGYTSVPLDGQEWWHALPLQ